MARRNTGVKTRLDQYRKRTGETWAAMAARSDGRIDANRLSQINRRAIPITRDDAFLIQELTDFYVDAADCPGKASKTAAAEPPSTPEEE